MIFSSKWEFIDVVHSDSVLKKRDIHLVKNDRERVYARCKGVGCPWMVHANNITGEPSFQIMTYNSTHTCVETYHITSIRSKWLNGRYGYQFINDPKKKVTHFQTELMVELGVNVTPHQVYKCKKLALEDEAGNAYFQYSILWDYAQEIRRTNPGSTILIGMHTSSNGPVLFDRMYFCLNACKVGFCRGCRPLIGVDGTHLKGPHGGILFTTVGVDPNNNIFLIAYAVVGKETGDTWEWFLGILKRDLEIQKDDNLTFISDKQKGLIQAFKKIFPNAEMSGSLQVLHLHFPPRLVDRQEGHLLLEEESLMSLLRRRGREASTDVWIICYLLVDGAENVRGNEGVHVDEHVMGEGNACIQGEEGGNEIRGNEGGNETGENEGVQGDDGGLDQGDVDFWDITSQLSDELSKQSVQHMMSNACNNNIFKHLGKKKSVAASGSTPTRAPPSMYQQYARSSGDGDLAKESFKFVTLNNLKSFMKN
ncbi:hypothetical protein ACS0TY_018554 [Phlomoides rotata]